MGFVHVLAVTGQIEKYGAYAGIASILGLAVLALLYFSQARELKRLRDWAGRAPERSMEVNERGIPAPPARPAATVPAPQQPRPP
ncbi:MAG: hypothetical protein NTV40_01295, partial [Solirubrobacterales bacterium]|nr:hypothetical protein [Solirubrobacterales bacterium]